MLPDCSVKDVPDRSGYPPYGEGGRSVAGENPVVWVTEFYATPFDRLVRKEPENSWR